MLKNSDAVVDNIRAIEIKIYKANSIDLIYGTASVVSIFLNLRFKYLTTECLAM